MSFHGRKKILSNGRSKMKLVKKTYPLSDVHIQLYSHNGNELLFTNPKDNEKRKKNMFEVYTKDINKYAIKSIKIDEIDYLKSDEIMVEITYDKDLNEDEKLLKIIEDAEKKSSGIERYM